MTHSSSNNLTYRLIIDRMHFNNPYFVISYLLLIDAVSIVLLYLGHPKNGMFAVITFITGQVEVIYFAFAIRVGLNKFREVLEIGNNTNSPLRSLFVSEDAFSKHKNQIIGEITSKWQLYLSIPYFLFLAYVLYNLTLPNENPVFGKGGLVWEILMSSYYLLLGIIYFAVFSFVWTLLCIITGLMRLKDAEGLKIKESIKSFKTLVNIKQYNQKVVEESLEGYYTYNRFLMDAGKITEFVLYFAVMVAIVAILFSVNWIVIGGLVYHEWVWHDIVWAILLDIIAILIFISPLFVIHGVLKAAKSEISNIINDVYEYNRIHAVVQSASFSHVDENLINNFSSLKGIVDEVDSLKTWPVDLEAIVRLIVTTIVPAMLLFISQIVDLIGKIGKP